MKFDYQWSPETKHVKSLQPLFDLDPAKYPELAEVLKYVNNWNLKADTNSVAATIVALTLNELRKKQGTSDAAFVHGYKADEKLYAQCLEIAQQHLLKHFGTIEVPIHKIQRFERNGITYPVHGFPDALMANYAINAKDDGSYTIAYGDTYIQFASFGKNGLEQLESLLPFSTTETAGEYKDQLKLYNQLKTRKMTLDKKKVLESAVKIYHPG